MSAAAGNPDRPALALLDAWPDRLPAITAHQPYPSLVAAWAKSVETRPRPTKYRGVVGIHASQRLYTAADKQANRPLWHAVHDRLDLERNDGVYLLPYGSIVAVALLVDSVPIVEDCGAHFTPFNGPTDPGVIITRQDRALARLWVGRESTDLTAQVPFGDYTEGRYGHVLANIVRLPEPVPARGQQAVPWRATPAVTDAVREQLEAAQPCPRCGRTSDYPGDLCDKCWPAAGFDDDGQGVTPEVTP